MSEIYEAGQVVQIENVLGPDLPGTSYFRLSENGNWYELSERMSGGMSTKRVFDLGDVELLGPQSKIVHDGAASMPAVAAGASTAPGASRDRAETADTISGRFLADFAINPAGCAALRGWGDFIEGRLSATPVDPMMRNGDMWLLGHDVAGAPVVLGTITGIDRIVSLNARVEPLVENSWPVETFPDHPANHHRPVEPVADGSGGPCGHCGHQHAARFLCGFHAITCRDRACLTEAEVNHG